MNEKFFFFLLLFFFSDFLTISKRIIKEKNKKMKYIDFFKKL
jgi:hypothetical protein